MEIDKYVKQYQPILERTFSNALLTNKIPHAFLLSGYPGIPLKDIAIYMAKSLLCENPNPLADLTCNVCKRIDNGEYPDLSIFDAAEEAIKKDNVEEIIKSFSRTALEKGGKMIYIIHLVEIMNDESINALLKFLEEPVDGTYAILTTENDSKVLPTIISRCETIRLILRKQADVLQEAINEGVAEEDAIMLSSLYNDAKTIKEIYSEKEYKLVKEAFLDFINNLSSKDQARFSIENVALTNVKGKPQTRLFFDMVIMFLQDIANLKQGYQVKLKCYEKIACMLTSFKNIDKITKEVMLLKRKVETNVNSGLLLVHLANTIYKG